MFRSASRQRILRISEWCWNLFRPVIGLMLSRHSFCRIGIRPVHMDMHRIERRHERQLLRAAPSECSMRIIAQRQLLYRAIDQSLLRRIADSRSRVRAVDVDL